MTNVKINIYNESRFMGKNKVTRGSIGYPFIIESVSIIPNAHNGKDVLMLGLIKSYGIDKDYSYKIIGKRVYDKLKKDLGVDCAENLIGKKVVGFIDSKKSALDRLDRLGVIE